MEVMPWHAQAYLAALQSNEAQKSIFDLYSAPTRDLCVNVMLHGVESIPLNTPGKEEPSPWNQGWFGGWMMECYTPSHKKDK